MWRTAGTSGRRVPHRSRWLGPGLIPALELRDADDTGRALRARQRGVAPDPVGVASRQAAFVLLLGDGLERLRGDALRLFAWDRCPFAAGRTPSCAHERALRPPRQPRGPTRVRSTSRDHARDHRGFYDVHSELGSGFLESAYTNALAVVLTAWTLRAERQVRFEVNFRGVSVGRYVADLVVESKVVVETKAARAIDPHPPRTFSITCEPRASRSGCSSTSARQRNSNESFSERHRGTSREQ